MQIQDVINYEEVKKRWIECTKNLLEKYPSYQMERYIRMSKENISDKKKFINSLYQDSFFNVYFRNIFLPTMQDEGRPILWVNFPKREMNQTYLYEVSPMHGDKIETAGDIMQIVAEQEGRYLMDYELGKKGEIITIAGSIESKHQNKLYTKQMTVKSENIKIDSHFTGNVII